MVILSKLAPVLTRISPNALALSKYLGLFFSDYVTCCID